MANGTVFPATGNFRVLIDSELILVGARSGNTLSSLTRGIEVGGGITGASSHSSGAAVTHVFSKGGLDQYLADRFAWTNYTPTWTSDGTNPAIGNGTITGRYIYQGNLVLVYVRVNVGSTSTVGTGNYLFSLPTFDLSGASNSPQGTASFQDASAGTLYGGLVVNGGGSPAQAHVYTLASPGVRWGAASPVVPASGDVIQMRMLFQG